MADKILNSIVWPDMPNDKYYIPYDKIWNILPSKTLPSAPIHSFSDGADNIPIKAMSVQVDAVQDTNGYGYPWIGGAGVNKWDEEWEIGVYNTSTGEKSPSTTQIRSKNYIPVRPSTDYRVVVPSATYCRRFYYDADHSFLSSVVEQGNVTITTPSGCAYMTFQLGGEYGTTYNHDIALNYPSSVTTYSPYANICPISARSSASVVWTGANVWDEQWELGYYDQATGAPMSSSNQIRSKNTAPIRVFGGQTYAMVGGSQRVSQTFWYDEDDNFISNIPNASDNPFIVTAPANACYLRFGLPQAYGTTYNNDVSINLPSTDTEYHAYNERTVTMSFGTGTYGGKLDYVDGKNWNRTDDRAIVELDSTFAGTIDLVTNANTQQVIFRACLTDAPDTTKLTQVQTNYFESGSTADTPYRARVNTRGTNLYDAIISFPVGTFADVADFKTNWLSGKTLQVAYYIATPTVLPLTASDDSYTNYGGNTVYADCGDSSLTYRQDIGLLIGG